MYSGAQMSAITDPLRWGYAHDGMKTTCCTYGEIIPETKQVVRHRSSLRWCRSPNRCWDTDVEMHMSTYRCGGIDVEVRFEVEIPIPRFTYRDTDVEVSMSMCRTAIEIPISRYRCRTTDRCWDTDVELQMSRYRCRGIDVDVPDSYRDTDIEHLIFKARGPKT